MSRPLSPLLLLLLPLALARADAPPPSQETVQSVVDEVFDTPEAKSWSKSASEQEVAAAKFQLADWVSEHPVEASRVYGGLQLDEAKFHRLLGEYFDYCMDPERSFNQLDRVATLSDEVARQKGLTDEALRDLSRNVFEGGGLGLEKPLREALAPEDWSRLPATGLRLDPKAFELVRSDSQRVPAELDSLASDRSEAERLGLADALAPAFKQRARDLDNAASASREFASVLAKNPGAAESLSAAELKLLSHSRNELYRWLAAADLARGEHRFRRLRAQLDETNAAERIVAGLPLDEAQKAAYGIRLAALKDALDAHIKNAEKARRLLESGAESDLNELQRLSSSNEREALRLEGEVLRLLETPRLVRKSLREEAALSWWRRLLRWLFVTFLPRSERGRRYLAERGARDVLLAHLARASRY